MEMQCVSCEVGAELVNIIQANRRSQWPHAFARSNAGVVGSNPTRGMDVYVRLFCVCAVLCIGRGISTGWSLVQGVLLSVYRITKLKKQPGLNKGL
jgi:hypothetical protein